MAQLQKTPVKQRKKNVQPGAPSGTKYRNADIGSVLPNPISMDQQKITEGKGVFDPPSGSLSPGRGVGLFCPSVDGASNDAAKVRKNTEPIFGLQRNQELASPVQLAENAEYAWSAERAEFAAVTQRAEYALKADRLIGDSALQEINGWPENALAALTKLKTEFDGVEFQQRGNATLDVKRSKFAGCADSALYAAEAREAHFALDVTGKNASVDVNDGRTEGAEKNDAV